MASLLSIRANYLFLQPLRSPPHPVSSLLVEIVRPHGNGSSREA